MVVGAGVIRCPTMTLRLAPGTTQDGTQDSLHSLLGEAQGHEAASRLSALCFDVLSHSAEARSLSTSRRALRLRAAAHRISRADGDTMFGNVLQVLERGPENPNEWSMIAAFAVRGLELKLVDASASERRELVERFARHGDWLELATPYAPYRFVGQLLSESSQLALIEALETGLLAPPDGPSVAAFRGRAMLRIQVLSQFQQTQARVVIARAAESSPDVAVADAARHALGSEPAPTTEGFELRGAVGRIPRLSVWRVMQYVLGIPLLTAFFRAISYALGLERNAKVRLESKAVHVYRETRLFGRVVRASDASYALKDIECATREVSMPAFQVLFGALSLALGVVLAVMWASDSFARDDSSLLVSAALALGAGVGLDLLFAGWGGLRKERAGFEMFVDNERVVALRKVDPERAQRLVEQIARRRT